MNAGFIHFWPYICSQSGWSEPSSPWEEEEEETNEGFTLSGCNAPSFHTREGRDVERDASVSRPGPGLTSTPSSNNLLQNSHLQANANNNDLSLADLTADPAMMSLLSSANESELQDLMRDLDFSFLDVGPQMPSSARENGQVGLGSSFGIRLQEGDWIDGRVVSSLFHLSPMVFQPPDQAHRRPSSCESCFCYFSWPSFS